MPLIGTQVEVPEVLQTVTLTHGSFIYGPMVESHVEPLTVRESTLLDVPPPPFVTVSPVEPDMLTEVAMMVVVPAATAVAFPLEAIVATDTFDELHVTDVVRFCVELSE